MTCWSSILVLEILLLAAIGFTLVSGAHDSKPIAATSVRGGFALHMNGNSVPQAGSNFQADLRLPFLGRQTIRLNISDRCRRGRLKIDGLLTVDAHINYEICEHSGSILFRLPVEIQRMLRRYRTKLLKAIYIPETDTVVVEVLPPLPRPLRIEMPRIS